MELDILAGLNVGCDYADGDLFPDQIPVESGKKPGGHHFVNKRLGRAVEILAEPAGGGASKQAGVVFGEPDRHLYPT